MSPFAREFEQIATVIGSRIVREACWHENRCNWLGAQSSQPFGRASGGGITYQTYRSTPLLRVYQRSRVVSR